MKSHQHKSWISGSEKKGAPLSAGDASQGNKDQIVPFKFVSDSVGTFVAFDRKGVQDVLVGQGCFGARGCSCFGDFFGFHSVVVRSGDEEGD